MRPPSIIALAAAVLAVAGAAAPNPAKAALVCSSSRLGLVSFDSGIFRDPAPPFAIPEVDSCVAGLATASTELSRQKIVHNDDGTEADILGQTSMSIAVGTFRGFASVSSQSGSIGTIVFSTGSINDTITPSGGGAPGTRFTMVVPIHVTGSDELFNRSPFSTASASFTFACSTYIDFLSRSDCGDGLINATSPDLQAVDQTFLMSVPLEIGHESEFFPSFEISAGFIGTALGVAEFDLLHTGIFGPAKILDASGNQVFDVALASGSGFNYLAGATAPTSTDIPEPATLTLLCGGLLGLCVLRKRRACRCR